MPELPEVETMRRGVSPIIGSQVNDFVRLPCQRRPVQIKPRIDAVRRRVVGRTVTGVDRIGKRVVVRFDSDDSLVFEPRMTGLVLIDSAPTLEHLRVRLDLSASETPHLYYWDRRGLGSIHLFSAAELKARFENGSLGPDALVITADQLREKLRRSRRAIKVALLDQSVVAGVGNLYASEILHLAGVHPETRCDRLTRPQYERIHARQLEVLELAIQYEGSTLSDGTYRNALNDPGGYQNQHRVYDREGESCPSCGAGEVRRIVQAQRATFFCPRCQKKRGQR